MISSVFLFYLVFTALLAYLAIAAFLQTYKSIRRAQNISLRKQYYMKSLAAESAAKEELLKAIESNLGCEKADLVRKGEIWRDMPLELVRVSLGYEGYSKKQVTSNSVIYKLYYGEYENRLKNVKYTFEVKIKNGIVDSWKDLI